MGTLEEARAKEHWYKLYDDSLKICLNEDEHSRDISMLLLVLNKKFIDQKTRIENLKGENQKQVEQIEEYKQRIGKFEKTCKCSTLNDDVNASCDLLDDVWNQQISELDIDNLIAMNESGNNDIIIESETSETNVVLSPKLNKSKADNRALKSKVSRNLSPKLSPKISSISPKKRDKENYDSSVICGTPEIFITRPKKFRQSRLHPTSTIKKNKTKNIFKSPVKADTLRKSEKRMVEDSDDDDATMYFPSTSTAQVNNVNETQDDGVDVETMLNDINKTIFTQLTQAKKVKKCVLNNSYDQIPENKKYEPKYAHRHSPVRKKSERELLPGWACEECEKYYSKRNLNTQELKERINACSKHKYKHNPFVIYTPPGYWNPDFSEPTEIQ